MLRRENGGIDAIMTATQLLDKAILHLISYPEASQHLV